MSSWWHGPVGAKPASKPMQRALRMDEGDAFFTPLPPQGGTGNGQSYADFLSERHEQLGSLALVPIGIAPDSDASRHYLPQVQRWITAHIAPCTVEVCDVRALAPAALRLVQTRRVPSGGGGVSRAATQLLEILQRNMPPPGRDSGGGGGFGGFGGGFGGGGGGDRRVVLGVTFDALHATDGTLISAPFVRVSDGSSGGAATGPLVAVLSMRGGQSATAQLARLQAAGFSLLSLLGLAPCHYFACAMNAGDTGVGAGMKMGGVAGGGMQRGGAPPHLCPVCLRKLWTLVPGFDAARHYELTARALHVASCPQHATWAAERYFVCSDGKEIALGPEPPPPPAENADFGAPAPAPNPEPEPEPEHFLAPVLAPTSTTRAGAGTSMAPRANVAQAAPTASRAYQQHCRPQQPHYSQHNEPQQYRPEQQLRHHQPRQPSQPPHQVHQGHQQYQQHQEHQPARNFFEPQQAAGLVTATGGSSGSGALHAPPASVGIAAPTPGIDKSKLSLLRRKLARKKSGANRPT